MDNITRFFVDFFKNKLRIPIYTIFGRAKFLIVRPSCAPIIVVSFTRWPLSCVDFWDTHTHAGRSVGMSRHSSRTVVLRSLWSLTAGAGSAVGLILSTLPILSTCGRNVSQCPRLQQVWDGFIVEHLDMNRFPCRFMMRTLRFFRPVSGGFFVKSFCWELADNNGGRSAIYLTGF